ncbi:hypothetical protein KSP39_PZI019190 [Platanthera zijinensis]|uniref:Uncharacterized protein n=1 Tax=Platanthera zijinensis TaxID=2320716 RepID=A0AAP0B1T3_9ASPA
MYATTCTRPDIAFTVGMLSRFTSNPEKDHWDALDKLMRYLKYTEKYALCYSRHPLVLEGYSDASWCSEIADCRSTSGFVFTLGGAAVAWKSKKQTCIALSSMESELYALASAGEEAEWIRDMILDIPMTSLKMNSISIYCDNQGTKTIATNMLFNGKRRQLRMKQAWLTYLTSQGIISLLDVRSKDNVADVLTKCLCKVLTSKTSGEMRLTSI